MLNPDFDPESTAIIRAAQELIQAALRPNIDLDAFLTEVLNQTQRLVPFDVGWLLLREGDSVRIRATDQAHRADIGVVFPADDCISGLSMLRRAPIHVPDLARMPDDLRQVYKPSRVAEPVMRSELVVPMMIGDDAIGSLNIESRQADAFAPRRIELLWLLADHAALAIELARSRQEAAALAAVSLQLARETEISAVLRTVLERGLTPIAAHFGQLLLSDGPNLVVQYTTNVPPRDLGLRIDVQSCICGLAVQERKPVLVPDVTRPDYFVVDLAPEIVAGGRLTARRSELPRYARVLEREKERIRAEFAAPIWAEDRIIGVLNVETPREGGFSEQQRHDLAAFGKAEGARFAVALKPEGHIDQLELRALLAAALARAETSFGQLLKIEDDELVIVQTTGSEPVGTRVPAARSVSGRAVTARAAIHIPEVEAEPLYRRYLGEEMKSELAVPLISGERVIGVLNVESPAPAFFTAEHARILQTLAGQAAVAIERAQRTEIERLAAIGGLAGDIIHRLNNPIGALSGWLDMLARKPFYGQLVAEYPYVAQFVSRAERDLAHARSIIQELRTELRRAAPSPIDLADTIDQALERSALRGSSIIRVAKKLPPEPLRVAAGPSLVGVFWNLFDNARKAMPDGGFLTISAGAAAEPGWIVVEVADTGVGIEPWRLPYIFDAGASTTADRYAPAHGLGLWWAHSQVESFGGKLEAIGEPSAASGESARGTRFVLRLRQA